MVAVPAIEVGIAHIDPGLSPKSAPGTLKAFVFGKANVSVPEFDRTEDHR